LARRLNSRTVFLFEDKSSGALRFLVILIVLLVILLKVEVGLIMLCLFFKVEYFNIPKVASARLFIVFYYARLFMFIFIPTRLFIFLSIIRVY